MIIAISVLSSKYNDEERVMHSKSDNIEITTNDKADKYFQSRFSRYQIGLEISMKGSDFVFDYVHLLYYKCHEINSERVGSYIDAPDWIKNKKSNNIPYQ